MTKELSQFDTLVETLDKRTYQIPELGGGTRDLSSDEYMTLAAHAMSMDDEALAFIGIVPIFLMLFGKEKLSSFFLELLKETKDENQN